MENSGERTSMAPSMGWSQINLTSNWINQLLLADPKSRWVCFKGVTLILVGPTSTSSQIEQGSILEIIPDRAQFHLKNVILHIVLKLFSQSTQAYRLHRSVWRRIRLFHALQTASPSSVAGPHNAPSASSAPWHHFFSSRNFCVLIFFYRSGWLLCSPLWLSPSPLPFLLNRDGARSPSLDS